MSERTLREWLKKGLSHSVLPSGTILLKYSAIDDFYIEKLTEFSEQLKSTPKQEEAIVASNTRDTGSGDGIDDDDIPF